MEGCRLGVGGELVRFESMEEFYFVTKSLFMSEDGLVLRRVGLSVWVARWGQRASERPSVRAEWRRDSALEGAARRRVPTEARGTSELEQGGMN